MKSKLAVIGSASLILLLWAVTAKYPDRFSLLEKGMEAAGIPFWSHGNSGISYGGIIALAVLVAGGVLLAKSLKSPSPGLVVLGVILATSFVPSWLVTQYQTYVAAGIDAIAYEPRKSECRYEISEERLMAGTCKFQVRNMSGREVSFELSMLPPKYPIEAALLIEQLKLVEGEEVRMLPKQSGTVDIPFETEIPPSFEASVISGSFSDINIRISGKEKTREL